MIDQKLLKTNPNLLSDILVSRNKPALDVHEIYQNYLKTMTAEQSTKAKLNEKSREFGILKSKNQDTTVISNDIFDLKNKLIIETNEAQEAKNIFTSLIESIPNIISNDVPKGIDENDNVELHKFGNIPNIINPKDHVDIGGSDMDFETATKLSGSRYVVLKNDIAKLERVLGQFMLDVHTKEHGYTECSIPLIVNHSTMYGTGQLPKFEEDLFKLNNDQYLIPTAEVSLTNMYRDQIIDINEFPIRLTALSNCFRSEAGSSGKDTRGLIRQHQFQKVELVSIVTPDKSKEEHECMLECCESILKRLELPFRTMLLCSGDMGFSAHKTYDIEVWLPSQNRYREISSVSNCGDFQGRRMNSRVKINGVNEIVHTLNGSGLAVGRTLVAILENYQTDNGFDIPDILKKYF